MQLFDLHADIGYDVYVQHRKGVNEVIDTHHAPKMKEGGISVVCMASFFDGKQDWNTMQDMIQETREELNQSKCFNHILTKEDMPDALDASLHAIMSVEGMCGIRDDVEAKVQWMYEQGVRLASLVWNEENALAAGAPQNPDHGLSELGIRVVKEMDRLNMVIDVSHANEKTFWDIMKHTKGKVIATHSDVRSLSDHARNLNDEQIQAICERGGLIGMNAVYMFVSKDHQRCGVDALADHAAYIKAKYGAAYLACGFDFMDFYEDSIEDEMVDGMPDARFAQAFPKALAKRGFTEEEIRMVCFDNARNLFLTTLP